MKKKIVVIGGGIAGQSAAWMLAEPFDVTLLERDRVPGGNHRQWEGDGQVLNLGASYLPSGDRYARALLTRFQVPEFPVGPRSAAWMLEGRRAWLSMGLLILGFAAIYGVLALLSLLVPSLRELPLSRVISALPAGLRRRAVLAIGYDPITLDDLDGLLFFPYIRYFLWSCLGVGYQVRWGELSGRRLPEALGRMGVTLHTSTEVTGVARAAEGPGFRVTARGADGGLRELEADHLIVACYPSAAAEILREVLPADLRAGLAGAKWRPGAAMIFPAPARLGSDQLHFYQGRTAAGRPVSGMLDRQFSAGLARVFHMDNTTRADVLDELGTPDGAVRAEHDAFVHYAPDHRDTWLGLRPLLARHRADPSQRIHFCSYVYHPSGFRNADQP